MFHKVKFVRLTEKYILEITFEDNTIKNYDVAKLFKKCGIFQNLELITDLFEQVQVDTGGHGISWNDEIDLSCNELWEKGNEAIDMIEK